MDILLVTHISKDVLPTREGELKRLQYFTATPDSLKQDEYYWGANKQTKYSKQAVESGGQTVTLPTHIELTVQDDLYVNSRGQLIKAKFNNKENPQVILENLFG